LDNPKVEKEAKDGGKRAKEKVEKDAKDGRQGAKDGDEEEVKKLIIFKGMIDDS